MISPLVNVAWLVERLGSGEHAIVDVRWYLADHDQGRAEYDEGHIPGARHLDLESDLSASEGPGRHPLPKPEVFAETLAANGISNDHHVIVYDDGSGAIAARLWWMMRWVGHHEVSILDGGWAAWLEAGHQIEQEEPDRRPAAFFARTGATRTIGRIELLASLGDVTVLDARPAERYRGELEPVDAAPGHIPTAISNPTSEHLDRAGRFRSPEELRAHFAELGVTPEDRVVSSCGSGVTACHTIFAFHLAGLPEPALYPGSWSEWATAGMPAAMGSEPGSV